MGALGYPEFELKPRHDESRDLIHVNGTTTLYRGTGAIGSRTAFGALARPAHGLAGGAGAVHRTWKRVPGESRNRPDLHTCLGMAYAMNFEVYKSMDALEEAVAAGAASTSWRS